MKSTELIVFSILRMIFLPLLSLILYIIPLSSVCINNDFFCYIHSPNLAAPLGLNFLNNPFPALPNPHRQSNSNLPHLLPRRPPPPINRLPLRNNRLKPLILANQKPRQKIPPSLLEHRHHRRWINLDLLSQFQNPIINVISLLVLTSDLWSCSSCISHHHHEPTEILISLRHCHRSHRQLC